MNPERNFAAVPDPRHEIEVGQRVRNDDYGAGTIVADLGAIGVQILWDKPRGTVGSQLMLHDRSYMERLERI